jgi:signal peptidase I
MPESPGFPGRADPSLRAAVALTVGSAGEIPPVGELLVAAASIRPATGWEMARAVEAALPGAVEEREGGVYTLLAGLEREGRIAGAWSTGPDGLPRRAYSVPGVTPGDGAAGGPAPGRPGAGGPAPLDPDSRTRLLRAAREAAQGVPDPFERESARAEILSHLEDSAAAHAALGLGPAAAARAALRDFGDPWKVRTDLGRVHRGRPVIVYPRTLGEWVRSCAMYDLVPLCAVLGLLLLVRWQVVQAYNIPTKSMEPTLHGEEDHPDFILVDKTAFRRREPERFDIVVFYPPRDAERLREGQEPSAFVKRCVGLGGDTLNLLGGDVYVDGRLARRSQETEDAMMVPLYDLAADLRETSSRARLRDEATVFFEESWKPRCGGWSIRSGRLRAVPGSEPEARLALLRDLDNGYTEPGGGPGNVNQAAPAGDLEVRFVATAGDDGSVAGADLTEGTGDGQERHSVRLGKDGVTLTSGGRTWTGRRAGFSSGRPVEVRLRNVDDRLTVWLDGEVVLREELPPRASIPEDPASGGVELVAEGGPVTFGGVKVLRDIVYLREKNSDWPRKVPEGKLFMMGDNTGNSHDSRVWGPVDRSALIGYPFAIVYPPSRARVLR